MRYDRYTKKRLGKPVETVLFRDDASVPQEWLDADGFIDGREAEVVLETLQENSWVTSFELDESTSKE